MSPAAGAREGDRALADEWLSIGSLDLDGQGVARSSSGKVVFVEGALPGEQVKVAVEQSKNNWARGSMTALRHESAQRVVPACPHFGVCGGCKTQHLDAHAQVAVKQRAMEDSLWHLGKVKAGMVLRPIIGPAWGYRHRARLTMFYLVREQRMLIGFHERKSSHVADIMQCPVMPTAFSALIPALHALIDSMEQRQRMPQIEVAVGANVTALVLRHLNPLPKGDLERLRDFARVHGVQWWLQPNGPESARRLDVGRGGDAAGAGARAGVGSEPSDVVDDQLFYELPEFDVRMPFRPVDFTQVNPAINRVLVNRAVALLEPQPGDRVIDWFCGMGNFTLPVARRGARVKGVEGSRALVEQARANAALHSLQKMATFELADLFEMNAAGLAAHGKADRWLLDPPRDGCFALIKALVATLTDASLASVFEAPSRIVYVSCDPSTLARDAGLLVHKAGYRCSAAGVVNMFPHTAHVESIAVFDRDVQA